MRHARLSDEDEDDARGLKLERAIAVHEDDGDSRSHSERTPGGVADGEDMESDSPSPAGSSASAAAAAGRRALLVAYAVLACAILAISCAGTLLQLLEAPPMLKAFWRLFFVSFFLLPGFLRQYSQAPLEVRQRFFEAKTLGVLACTGVVTSAHFACWVWSLAHTSLAHSLFFVCAHPLLVVLIMVAHTGARSVSKWEYAGVAVGLVGSGLMLADSSGGNSDSGGSEPSSKAVSVTWQGDVMAFLGAVMMVGYLYAGKHCRAWLPLFMYAWPVTLCASFPLLLASAATEDGISLSGLGSTSVFGFLHPSSIGLMLLIALGPGLTGHLGIQFVLAHIPPLAVSIAITVEPIIGVFIGILFGVEVVPHLLTLLGGPLTFVGCLFAIYGGWLRETAVAVAAGLSEEEGELELEPAFGPDSATASGPGAPIRHKPLSQDDRGDIELSKLEWTEEQPPDFDLHHPESERRARARSSEAATK